MKRRGFTLIELMVVILIIAILAAILAPMLSGRINEAKWAEGKAGAGTIVTGLRAYIAEHEGVPTTPVSGSGAFVPFGIADGDLQGKYFDVTSYEITSATYDATTGNTYYQITITAPAGISPNQKTLTTDATATGVWADVVPTP